MNGLDKTLKEMDLEFFASGRHAVTTAMVADVRGRGAPRGADVLPLQQMMLIVIGALAFGLSFFFALGGVGSAVALVPALMAIGVPGGLARPVALLANVVSLAGATTHNLRNGRFRPGSWWPLILFSLPAAAAGVWLSSRIPQDILLGVFASFMVFSGLLMLQPQGRQRGIEREAGPPMLGALLGA